MSRLVPQLGKHLQLTPLKSIYQSGRPERFNVLNETALSGYERSCFLYHCPQPCLENSTGHDDWSHGMNVRVFNHSFNLKHEILCAQRTSEYSKDPEGGVFVAGGACWQ